MKYTCPMHKEIHSDKSGNCPKCGMQLVESSKLKVQSSEKDSQNNYQPLMVLLGLILLVTIVLALRDVQLQKFLLRSTISYFMIGFFLVFSGFKLMDLKGFASGYSSYDLLARKLYSYGYIYPFIEVFFGISMILNPESKPVL